MMAKMTAPPIAAPTAANFPGDEGSCAGSVTVIPVTCIAPATRMMCSLLAMTSSSTRYWTS